MLPYYVLLKYYLFTFQPLPHLPVSPPTVPITFLLPPFFQEGALFPHLTSLFLGLQGSRSQSRSIYATYMPEVSVPPVYAPGW